MSRTYFLSELADADFAEQFAYFSEVAGWDVAERFFAAMLAAFDLICLMPEIGHRQSFDSPALANVRVWRAKGFERYSVYYRPLGNRIEILRILHVARDIDSIFESDD